MILTPLQAIALVALIVILCAAVMAIIHLYLPHGSKAFIELKTRVKNLEAENTNLKARTQLLEERSVDHQVYGHTSYRVPAHEDPMALWDAIVHDAHQHSKDHP